MTPVVIVFFIDAIFWFIAFLLFIRDPVRTRSDLFAKIMILGFFAIHLAAIFITSWNKLGT